MGEDESRLVLLRFSGDIHIKARATRHQFVRRLLHNLRDAISSQGITPRVRLSHNRVFALLPPGGELTPLARVFGVQSLSEARVRPVQKLGDVVEAGRELFADRVRGKRFAVRARRVGNRGQIPWSARAVERELGTALLPFAAGVDLEQPEATAYVELLENQAYFFDERVPGPAGLPLGVEGHAVALLSGGFDSAVAAWRMLRRGVALDYVFCNLGGASHRLGALRVAATLAERWHYGQQPRLHALDFAPVVEELRRLTEKRYWQVLLKRLMLRAGTAVAQELRAEALVTGEAVGQVSSQTLRNLAVISRATETMLLRPLVGSNKDEIIAEARDIGTFDLSRLVGEYCDLVRHRPATAASHEVVEAQEARLDPATLARCVAQRRSYTLRDLAGDALTLPELELDRVPEDAQVLDLRDRAAYESWHHPDALRLDFAHALEAYPSFDPGRPYLLYCDYGLLSAHLAELMRAAGLRSHHFRGGTRALRRWLEARH